MSYTLIHHATLIDGNGGAPVPDAAILVKDAVIMGAGPKSSIRLPDEQITLVDAGGGFVLPGLIDTHVHMMVEGYDLLKILQTPFSFRFYDVIGRLQRTLDAGVTSVRDAGGVDPGVKMAVEQGVIAGPRLQISISALSITGGHGDGWMLSGVEVNPFSITYPGVPDGICDGPESVRRKVREILRAGADVVKVHTTGGVLSPTDRPEYTQFSLEELRVIVEEATFRSGKRVMAHAQGAQGIKNAILAGIHSIEHGILLDDECIELMIKHGTFLVPTLIAPVAVVEIAEQKGTMPEFGLRKAKEAIEIHHRNTAKAYKAGVKIAMGTDTGVGNHGTNLRELGLMCGIGMSPMEAIVATTRTAAQCLGWDDRLGTIEVGKLADIVVAATDPLADVRSLENNDNIRLVMKDGRIVKDLR